MGHSQEELQPQLQEVSYEEIGNISPISLMDP
jgi:hypothetical protein